MPNERNAIDQSTALILADRTQSVDLYRAMCSAIAECARVDQVREWRSQAIGWEEYHRRAKNREPEELASAIRLRAERRAGELLIEMAERGERFNGLGGNIAALKDSRVTLADLNVGDNESADWQQLARIPATEFEEALAAPGVKRTYKVVAAYRQKHPATPKLPKQTTGAKRLSEHNAERQRRLLCEAVLKVADGKIRSIEQICEITGRIDAAPNSALMTRARMLPWLTIERTPEGYRLSVDEELRLICEDHAPRPQLNGAGVHAFIKRLAKEIDRKRKENYEKNKTSKWMPDNVSKIEQKRLLDWIEAELFQLTQLMASSGPDTMSAIRTQNHPDVDGERHHVLQEKHSNRTVDPRPC
jgi:hypothetical protein